jgi:competence protein ComEA
MLAVTVGIVLWIGWPAKERTELHDHEISQESPSQILSAESTSHPTVAAQFSSVRSATTASTAVPSKLDLNRATAEELQQLPGISVVLAQRVIERRTTHGPFRRIEDLGEIKGIGAKRLKQLQSLVMVGMNHESSRGARPRVKTKISQGRL